MVKWFFIIFILNKLILQYLTLLHAISDNMCVYLVIIKISVAVKEAKSIYRVGVTKQNTKYEIKEEFKMTYGDKTKVISDKFVRKKRLYKSAASL